MRPALPALLLLYGVALIGSPQVSADLYKWTDGQGQVHYSDKPPARQESQRIGRSSHPEREQEAIAARQALADKLSKSQQAKQAEQEAEAKRRAEQEKEQQKAESCRKARERLSLLQQNSRITRINDRGQQYVLDEGQRQSAIAEAMQRADELCK